MPPVEEVAPGHRVRCFRHEEVAAMEPATDYFEAFQREAERILGAARGGARGRRRLRRKGEHHG